MKSLEQYAIHGCNWCLLIMTLFYRPICVFISHYVTIWVLFCDSFNEGQCLFIYTLRCSLAGLVCLLHMFNVLKYNLTVSLGFCPRCLCNDIKVFMFSCAGKSVFSSLNMLANICALLLWLFSFHTHGGRTMRERRLSLCWLQCMWVWNLFFWIFYWLHGMSFNV